MSACVTVVSGFHEKSVIFQYLKKALTKFNEFILELGSEDEQMSNYKTGFFKPGKTSIWPHFLDKTVSDLHY